MVIVAHVFDIVEEEYPVIMQNPYGHSTITRDDLMAKLPKDAQLQEGHYDITGDEAKWLGFDLPEGYLD